MADRYPLAEGELLAGAGRLAGIPGVLIHGRIDLSCPLDTPRELARAWPDAELITIADRGHQGNPGERDAYLATLGGFARRWPASALRLAPSKDQGCGQHTFRLLPGRWRNLNVNKSHRRGSPPR